VSAAAAPATARPVPPPGGHPLARLWRYADGHRGQVVWGTVLTVLNKVFDVFPEILIGIAIDVIVNENESFVADLTGVEGRWEQLLILAAINAVVWIGESASEWGYQVVWRNLAQTVEHEARMDTYAHVQRLELGYFEDQSTGGLMSVLNDDVNQLERFLDVGATAIIQVVVNVLIVGAIFLLADPWLFLVAFAPIPVIVFGSFLYQRLLEPRYADVRSRVGHLSGTLSNNLGGIATIKAFTAEDRETARVAGESDAYREANRRAIRLSSAFVPIIRIAILAGFTMTLLVGGNQVLDGDLAVGFFSVLVFMTQRLLWPLTRLGETFDLYQRAMASTRRILDLLSVRPRIIEGSGLLPRPVTGAIRFDDVRFSYASGPEVLRGLDLDIPAGETHAVVGLTGAGKSTIVKLLLRLYEPSGGRVTVDGVDVRDRPSATCAAPSAWFRRMCSCSTAPCARTSPTATPTPPTRRSRRPRGWRRPTTSSRRSPRATTRWSASAARSSPAASGRGCRSRAPSCATRRSWCSTRRRAQWTTRPRPRSSGAWTPCRATGRRW
jgi:ATP-binding cassette, subfamily B, bacterial